MYQGLELWLTTVRIFPGGIPSIARQGLMYVNKHAYGTMVSHGPPTGQRCMRVDRMKDNRNTLQIGNPILETG